MEFRTHPGRVSECLPRAAVAGSENARNEYPVPSRGCEEYVMNNGSGKKGVVSLAWRAQVLVGSGTDSHKCGVLRSSRSLRKSMLHPLSAGRMGERASYFGDHVLADENITRYVQRNDGEALGGNLSFCSRSAFSFGVVVALRAVCACCFLVLCCVGWWCSARQRALHLLRGRHR